MLETYGMFGGTIIDDPPQWPWVPNTTSAPQPQQCDHCGQWHQGQCPRIKAIEYHENGRIKRVEYKD